MALSAPISKTIERIIPATAAGSDAELDLAVIAEAGTVSAVTYTPATVLTGADTNSRTAVVVDKGAAGSGTTIVATKAYTNGVNASADVPNAITLSATPANLVVAAGDVLVWQSTHVGSGLADPGGLVHIEITRGDVSA